LLIEFYDSPDPERRYRFPGKSVHSKLSLKKTLPSVLVLGGLTVGMLMTEAGRKLYVCEQVALWNPPGMPVGDCESVIRCCLQSSEHAAHYTRLFPELRSVNKALLIEHWIRQNLYLKPVCN
jgi:hypothetical protein